MIKLNFQTRITLWVAGILVSAIGITAVFFISTYSNEKLSSGFEQDLSATAQQAAHFESLLLSPKFLDPGQIQNSKEIIAVFSQPCSPTTVKTQLAQGFSKLVERASFPVQEILSTPEVKKLCSDFQKGNVKDLQLLGGGPLFVIPYILVFVPGVPEHLVLITADGFALASSAGATTIMGLNGDAVWKGSSDSDFINFLSRVQVDLPSLALTAKRALTNNLPGLSRLNPDGYVTYAPLLQKWVLLNIGSQHEILSSIQVIENQLGWLVLGFFCLVMIFSKRIAKSLGKPLRKLAEAADKLAQGEFNTRVVVTKDPEFRTVQKTFNHMAQELDRLLEVAKESSRMESELALAEKVQQVLFPPTQVKVSGLEIKSSVKNAAQCGGDWWGYIPIPQPSGPPKVLMMIGDVTGHGAPAALVTASAQGSLTILSDWLNRDQSLISDLRKVLSLFNQSVHRSSGGALSMSFLACLLDPANNTLTLANAGHNWPYLLVDGGIKAIGAASPVLGNDPNQVFEHQEIHPWKVGDKLFLYTDGLVDCYKDDQNLFDRRIFLRLLKKLAPRSAHDLLVDLMKERSEKIKGLKPADDVTVVVCSRVAEL